MGSVLLLSSMQPGLYMVKQHLRCKLPKQHPQLSFPNINASLGCEMKNCLIWIIFKTTTGSPSQHFATRWGRRKTHKFRTWQWQGDNRKGRCARFYGQDHIGQFVKRHVPRGVSHGMCPGLHVTCGWGFSLPMYLMFRHLLQLANCCSYCSVL